VPLTGVTKFPSQEKRGEKNKDISITMVQKEGHINSENFTKLN